MPIYMRRYYINKISDIHKKQEEASKGKSNDQKAMDTLESFDIDIDKAWTRVHFANMLKEKGINNTRDNKFNLPDLVKPESWQEPYHYDNVGTLEEIKDD